MEQMVCFPSPLEGQQFLFRDAGKGSMEEGSSEQPYGKVGSYTLEPSPPRLLGVQQSFQGGSPCISASFFLSMAGRCTGIVHHGDKTLSWGPLQMEKRSLW